MLIMFITYFILGINAIKLEQAIWQIHLGSWIHG